MTAKNVSALIRKVAPTPASPITRPPSAGPITREMLMPRPLSASAGPSSFLGTSCGSTARKAGVSNAEPASSTKIRMRSVIGVIAPITVSTHRSSITASIKICATMRSLRRSTMSASAPAGSANRNIGSAVAALTSDTQIGDGSSVVISQPVPTLATQAPIFATSVAVHTVRKAGTASGLHADGGGPAFCVSATRTSFCQAMSAWTRG